MPTAALAQRWHLQARIGFITPDGGFQTVRANGKRVTSDITAGTVFAFQAERRLTPRIGIVAGALGLSTHEFVVQQDFPDGTDFQSRDGFDFTAVRGGIALHLLPDGPVDIILEPFLSYAWYDDVVIGAAGPPFDRSTPAPVDVQPSVGGGLITGIELALPGGQLTISPWGGIAVHHFAGPFPDDPSIPGSGGDIDVNFNPIMGGVGIGFRF